MNTKKLIFLVLAVGIAISIMGCDSLMGSSGGGSNGNDSEESNGSDGPSFEGELNEETAKQAVLNFLVNLGIFPGNSTAQAQMNAITAQDQQDNIPPVSDDYLTSEATESGNIEVTMQIDSDGNIVPSPEWRNENSGYCLEKGKSFKTPVWNLRLTLFPESERVQINLIDIETGQIEASGNESVPGDTWVDDGIAEAWDEAGLPDIQKADSPCGADIELTLTFDSEVTAFVDGESDVARVQANIPLANDSDPEVFEGTSALLLTDFTDFTPPPPPDGSINCTETTTAGTIYAEVVIPDGNLDPEDFDDLQGMIDVTIRVVETESPILTRTCVITTPKGTGEQTLEDDLIWYRWFHVLNQSGDPDAPYSYFYGSLWEEMEDEPFGRAKREIFQSETFTDQGEQITLEEDTRLEIWTKELPPL